MTRSGSLCLDAKLNRIGGRIVTSLDKRRLSPLLSRWNRPSARLDSICNFLHATNLSTTAEPSHGTGSGMRTDLHRVLQPRVNRRRSREWPCAPEMPDVPDPWFLTRAVLYRGDRSEGIWMPLGTLSLFSWYPGPRGGKNKPTSYTHRSRTLVEEMHQILNNS